MTSYAPRKVSCPRCGHQDSCRLPVAVRAEDEPELVEDLRAGRLRVFACSACEHTYAVDDPLAWLDFERKHWIVCLPAGGERSWRTYENDSMTAWRESMVTHAPPLVRDMSGGFTVRTVFGLAALRDKVVALHAGLDDAWLEVLKLDLIRTVLRFLPEDRPRLIDVRDDALIFTVATRPGEVLAIPRSTYDALCMDPLSWMAAHEQVTRGPYVDVGRLLFSGRAEASVESLPQP